MALLDHLFELDSTEPDGCFLLLLLLSFPQENLQVSVRPCHLGTKGSLPAAPTGDRPEAAKDFSDVQR